MSQTIAKEDLPQAESTAPQPTPEIQQPPTSQQPEQTKKRNEKPERPRKVYDPLLEGWYYNEVNKRVNQEPEIFKNYQINPYTKKTLDYVTPKITERKKKIPDAPPQTDCYTKSDENTPQLTEDEKKILESYRLVKRAMDRSVSPPQTKFCEPQTEAMRLGWFPPRRPPPTNLECMYIKTCWSETPCCYFHPRAYEELTQNEQYDERFRAVHQTAEFIRTETKLKQFDAIMNPEGYRGKLKTDRVMPKHLSPKK